MKNLARYLLLLLLVIFIIAENITEINDNQTSTANKTINKSTSDIVGKVMYESPSSKVQKYIPLVLIGLGALVTTGLVILKKR